MQIYVLHWKKTLLFTIFWSLNSCCFIRKMERPCAWPTLYIEINGNGDDYPLLSCVFLLWIVLFHHQQCIWSILQKICRSLGVTVPLPHLLTIMLGIKDFRPNNMNFVSPENNDVSVPWTEINLFLPTCWQSFTKKIFNKWKS